MVVGLGFRGSVGLSPLDDFRVFSVVGLCFRLWGFSGGFRGFRGFWLLSRLLRSFVLFRGLRCGAYDFRCP